MQKRSSNSAIRFINLVNACSCRCELDGSVQKLKNYGKQELKRTFSLNPSKPPRIQALQQQEMKELEKKVVELESKLTESEKQ